MPESQDSEEVPFARVWDASSPEPHPPIVPPPVIDSPPIPPAFPPTYQQAYAAYPNYMGASYGYTGRVGKPGLITTLGILSIVFASLSILGSALTALQAMVVPMISQRITWASRISVATTSSPSVSRAIPAAPLGLPLTDRQTAVNVIAARQFLTKPRLAQLDGLLANGGQVILGVQPGAFISTDVRAAIKSTSRGKSASGGPGPDFIVTESGTIELYDANGVFRPDDHSQPVIRVASDTEKYLLTENVDATPPPSPPQSPGPATMATATAGSAPSPNSSIGAIVVDRHAVTLVVAESGVSLLLGIYLLVVGILALRGSPRARQLHLAYVLVKVPLAAVAAYAGMWLLRSFFQSVAPMGASSPLALESGTWTAVFFGTAYLLTILILLFTQTVRDYYRKSATSSAAH